MENKTILQIIKKDLEELRVLVEDLENTENAEQLLIDIAVAKARTLLQEFSLLKSNETIAEPVSFIVVEEKIPQSGPDVQINEVHIQHQIMEEMVVEEIIVQPAIEEEPVKETIEPAVETKELKTETIEPYLIETQGSFLSEPEHDPKEKKVFGEQFSKEPSLNDKLASQHSTEPKIKAKPISSIKAAIGLNDRFLFTRELFGNINSKFESTVETLDSVGNIVEAVEFLEQNFKWQKNETSLKFLDLVKRRFEK